MSAGRVHTAVHTAVGAAGSALLAVGWSSVRGSAWEGEHMAVEIVGAGLGRTGTHSLKIALEQLLERPCYHMVEVFARPDDPQIWLDAFEGRPPDWPAFLADFGATVDWPAAGCWRQLADAFPDAPVLLSVREPDSWWASASNTIFQFGTDAPPGQPPVWSAMSKAMLESFCPEWRDEKAAKAAFVAHNDEVRATIAADRLVEWAPGDGWEPLCRALGVAAPDQPYPHVNTTDEFRQMSGLPPIAAG